MIDQINFVNYDKNRLFTPLNFPNKSSSGMGVLNKSVTNQQDVRIMEGTHDSFHHPLLQFVRWFINDTWGIDQTQLSIGRCHNTEDSMSCCLRPSSRNTEVCFQQGIHQCRLLNEMFTRLN
jgi:hypothetical protein